MNQRCSECKATLDQHEWCLTPGCVNARQGMSPPGRELFMFAATQSALRFAEQGIDIRPQVEKEEAA